MLIGNIDDIALTFFYKIGDKKTWVLHELLVKKANLILFIMIFKSRFL